MRHILLSLFFVILLSSFASAEIIMNQQLEDIYNLGDTISIPTTIKASKDIFESFQMDLLCNGIETTFFLKDIDLSVGEEESLNPILLVNKKRLGNTTGTCKIKTILGGESVLTNGFTISDSVEIQIENKTAEFYPGENILIEGEAVKENGNNVEGFIGLEIISGNKTGNITQLGTVNNGFFSINVYLPKYMGAGNYLLKLNVYEKDQEGEITNNGLMNYNILIKQVPTSLEIFFENSKIEPGTDLRVKAILHDQTGEKIVSTAIITIKNDENKIIEQTEKPTDEFLEFPIAYNEPPAKWMVVAVSNKLTGEASFEIMEKQDIKVELINKNIILTNIGNVEYCNNTLIVKIGEDTLNLDVCLGIDKTQTYILSAPSGEYQIEIINNGESIITGNAILTGKITEIKKASKIITLVRYPIIWIFVIALLGFVALIIFKRGYKKSFLGHIPSKKKTKKNGKLEEHRSRWEKAMAIPLRKKSLITAKNKAELSLSLRGDKQSVNVIDLKIKNLKEIESKKGNAEETLQKIINLSEEKRAFVYENQDNIFFILAPIITKTFKNEKSAIKLAQKIGKILREHNKLFKQKIDYGISLNHGEIVAKLEGNILKFMSMGKLISSAKRVADLSDGEVFLTPEMNDRLMSDVKTQKHEIKKVTVYTIKQIIDRDEHREFISSFLKRLEGEKKK